MRSWRAALRIARRDALRARGRSALIVAMVALPVLALTGAVTLLEVYDLGPRERATRQLGAADAAYSSSGTGGPIVQHPRSTGAYEPAGSGSQPSGKPPTDPRTVIPRGSRVIPSRHLVARVRAHGELYSVQFHGLDYADPVAEGMVRQRAGRAPRNRQEVAVTTGLRDALALDLGDTLRVTSSTGGKGERSRTLTVVGVVVDPERLAKLGVVGLPGTLTANSAEQGEPAGATTWLADTPTPVSWQEVRAANRKGVVVTSRSVMLDPPPPSAVPAAVRDQSRATGMATAVGALVVAMAVLEVVLLAGAAFAVGTRRQSHQLALVAAGGGDARHVRRIVLAGGVVLGTAGAATGLALGVAGAAAAARVAAWLSLGSLPGSFGVPPLQAAGLALLGAVTGVLAALVPARGAARQDVVAALTGRRGTVRTRHRYPVIGVALFGLGAAMAGAGAAAAASANPATPMRLAALGIAGGAVVSQLGLIAAAPAIVGFASRLGRFLPAVPRIALRDAARNRARAAPAVAAVMAAVAGTSAVAVYLLSAADSDRRAYEPKARQGQAIAPVGNRTPAERATVRETVSSALPVTRTILLYTAHPVTCTDGEPCGEVAFREAPRYRCPQPAVESGDEAATARAAGQDPRCRPRWTGRDFAVVGNARAVDMLTGASPPKVERALAQGNAVVFDKKLVSGGTAYLRIVRYGRSFEHEQVTIQKVPAVYVDHELARTGGVLPPETARQLGLTADPSRLLFGTSRMPTRDEVAEAEAALEDQGLLLRLEVERGYDSKIGLTLLVLVGASAIVTLGASGIATGLALADGRADQTTLGAVGASPRIRRLLAASQAGTVSWLGSGLGILAGLVPGIAVVWAQPGLRIVIPWVSLALVLAAVPLLAMFAALLSTRSRIALARRIE